MHFRLDGLELAGDLGEAGVVRGSAEQMIGQLAKDHEAVARNSRTVADWADQMKDQVTLNSLANYLENHEETVCRLRALLA